MTVKAKATRSTRRRRRKIEMRNKLKRDSFVQQGIEVRYYYLDSHSHSHAQRHRQRQRRPPYVNVIIFFFVGITVCFSKWMVHLFSFYRLIAHQKEIAHTSAVEWARTIHSYERTHTHTYVLHIWNVPQIRMYTQVVTLEIDWYVPCDHYNSYGVFYFISSFCFAFRTIQIKTTTHTCCSISKSFRPIKIKKNWKKTKF